MRWGVGFRLSHCMTLKLFRHQYVLVRVAIGRVRGVKYGARPDSARRYSTMELLRLSPAVGASAVRCRVVAQNTSASALIVVPTRHTPSQPACA